MERKEIPFGFIEGEKIYLKGQLDFGDREIGVVKDNDQDTSVKYFMDRFEVLNQKIEDLETNIKTVENKGSFLMKLLHIKNSLSSYDGLGDYAPLLTKLEELEGYLAELIAQNRTRNSEIKKALLVELDEALEDKDWKLATEKIKDIKLRWLKTGKAEEEENNQLEEEFDSKVDAFFDKKKQFYEEKKKQIQERVDQYKDLINEIKALGKEDDLWVAEKKSKQLQAKWRSLGNVPSFQYTPLVRQFKRDLSNFQKLVMAFKKAARDSQDPAENLIRKLALLDEAKKIEFESSKEAVRRSKDLMEDWKMIGRLPKEHAKEVTERFMVICDKVQERRFLENLAMGTDEDYDSKNTREQISIKMRLMRDLLVRDEKELRSFYDNLEKMNPQRGQFNKVIANKLVNQKRKVIVKKEILRELKVQLSQ